MFKSAEKTALQEIGPRFTLKLRYIKKGIPAVRQLGAAPPPLMFDDGEEGVDPADVSDEAQQKHDSTMAQKSTPPAKDEEYIWQRKVCRHVSHIYRIELLTHALSRNWRRPGKRFSYSPSGYVGCSSTYIIESVTTFWLTQI